jgi:predicted kinase
MSRLVVLRGPSGSGKSTVARQLFGLAAAPTCLIDQDHYRFIFKPAGGGSRANAGTIHRMIEHNVLSALEDGYDVILEGILSVPSYIGVLATIFEVHATENFVYYFDISLVETLRRHGFRKSASLTFDEDEMREWYPVAGPCGYPLEQLIADSSTIEETVSRICGDTGIGEAPVG